MEYHSPFARPEDAGSDVQRRDVEIRLVSAELHQFPGESVAVLFCQRRVQQLECRTEEVRAHHRAQTSNVISVFLFQITPGGQSEYFRLEPNPILRSKGQAPSIYRGIFDLKIR